MIMNHTNDQNASPTHAILTTANVGSEVVAPQTLTELLCRIEANRAPNLSALKSKASLLSDLLNKPADLLTIQDLMDARPNLRSYLIERRLADNTIRAYVYEVTFLLKRAKALGWKPIMNVPPAWKTVMQLCIEQKCTKLCIYLMARRMSPEQVTPEDVQSWIEGCVKAGRALKPARSKKSAFWKLMASCGFLMDVRVRPKDDFGIRVEEFPDRLRGEVNELLTWKTAKFAIDRSKRGRIRPNTAENLKHAFSALFGFTQRVLGATGIESISDLVTADILNQYVDWAINERNVRGQSICVRLTGIKAAIRHPKYQHVGGPWFSKLIDSIPVDSESELKEKQAAKQIPYAVAETVHECIHAERRAATRRGEKPLALVMRDELLMLWLVVLPWRQNNLRRCRIEGPRPNLFKARLDPSASVSKTEWVEEALKVNPEAEFWQFKFSAEETKAKNEVHALVPRPLIPLLEEYLDHRKHLLGGADSNTLFLNGEGTMMNTKTVTILVGELTLRYVGKAVTPHTFRHIVAYGWLKDHPGDFLTVSKLLFHTNINTTIRCYASRFNESDGACGMERWFESRRHKAA
jgi:integrase